ncbi:MAG: hypothetical protein HGA63_09855, partial [Syntrophobacteraceae bacterium]|nr:hypothetical protein [Syntrophobacteraceae bacterium]
REQRQDRKKLMDRVIATLGRILRKDVHLLILNDASYLARVQALFRGRPVFVRNPEALARFRMVSMTLHADYAPLLRRMQKKLAEKLCRSSGAP